MKLGIKTSNPVQMKKLNTEEILKIPDLLLSPNEQNVSLALELLEHHSYAIPQILAPIEVFLVFNNTANHLIAHINLVLPDFSFEQSPLYYLYLLVNESHQSMAFSPVTNTIIDAFLAKETRYRTWLLIDPQKAAFYAKVANFLATTFDERYRPQKGHRVIEYFQLALKYAPNDSSICSLYANTLAAGRPKNHLPANHKEEVVYYYNKAYQLNPQKEFLHKLASFYRSLKALDQELATWERCIQGHPTDYKAFRIYAWLFVEQQNWSLAKKMAEQCLSLRKTGNYTNKDESYYLLGHIEWKGFNRIEIAEEHFAQAIAENEFYMDPLEALMELSLENDDYNKAIKWHKLYLQHYPLDIPLMQTIGDLYLQIYDLEEATRYYIEILDLNVAYTPALEGLKRIQQL